MFGVKAHGAIAFFENGQLRSISILLLDAGAWFGYVPDNLAQATAATRGPEFLTLFAQVSASTREGIAALAKSQEVLLGARTLLKHTAQVTHHGDLWSRLVVWPEHSVKLSLYRDEDGAKNLLAPPRRALKGEAQSRAYASLVQNEVNGDRRIDHIPVLPQGNRAYCGVSVLAMVMQHMGVRLETEELAAGAGIRFGSTLDAKTREIYDAAAAVGALRMDRGQHFETVRARASIDAGFPIVVFRHWSQERDFLHTQFAKRLAREPEAVLPRADMNDRKLWPRRGGFAHASVINGYNAKRGEVIFTESWGEAARNRRMRQEELEATSYLACYPRLV
jgi:hypothetical protein